MNDIFFSNFTNQNTNSALTMSRTGHYRQALIDEFVENQVFYDSNVIEY